MVRKLWAGALAGVLACAPGWAQAPKATTAAAATTTERVITVKEAGKPEQKCRVLRCWTQKDGSRICEVQDVATGEKMTLVEEVAGTNKKSLAQIFRWGKSETVPPGVPVAPKDAAVFATAPASRPGLFGRRAAKETVVTTTTTTTTTPAKANPRESWGKLERWTAKDSDKAVQAASTQAKAANDPLLHPEPYVSTPGTTVVKSRECDKGTCPPATVVQEGKPVKAPRMSLLSRLRATTAPAPVELAAPAPEAPGMGSVMAAVSPQMRREMDTVMTLDREGRPVVVPRSEVSPKMVAVDVSAPNAFSTAMPVRPPTHVAMPPMMMAGGGMMLPGMSMAPTMPPGMAAQPMMHPAMMAMAPVPYAAPEHDEAAYTAGLLRQLREGQLPSEREMAADHLSRVNWRTEPAVVQALAHCAKADPAPMVRACCVQSLAKMKANTVPVVQAVSACKQDSDSRVRQAAEAALSVLMAEK